MSATPVPRPPPPLRPAESAPASAWLWSLWPRPYERLIAKRYLYRRRRSLAVVAVMLVLLFATAGVEINYFLVPGHQAAAWGLAALLVPLVWLSSALLCFLSVFSTVAVIGVLLGVAALTVVMAVTSGFQGEIKNRVIGLNAHVMVLKYGTDFQEYEEVRGKLLKHPEVVAATPFVYNEMLIAKEGALSSGVLVKGVDVLRSTAVIDLGRWLLPGPDGSRPRIDALQQERVPNEGGPPLPGMFVGMELQRKLKLKVGDRVRLIAPLLGLDAGLLAEVQPDPEAQNTPIPPRAQEFRLAGVFSSGFDEYDRRLVVVALPQAQFLVGQGNIVTGIELRIRQVELARRLGYELVGALGGAPYRSLDWEELNHNLFTALALQKVVLALVLFLIILVAAFNIVASLTMMIIEKTREVAILKAMGMRAVRVAAVFRAVGMTIGLCGTALGIGMGLLLCAIIQRLGYLLDAKVYMIDKLPTQVSPRELLLTAVVTLLICFVATLYPSLRAARMHPVDGLRYE